MRNANLSGMLIALMVVGVFAAGVTVLLVRAPERAEPVAGSDRQWVADTECGAPIDSLIGISTRFSPRPRPLAAPGPGFCLRTPQRHVATTPVPGSPAGELDPSTPESNANGRQGEDTPKVAQSASRPTEVGES